MNKRLMTKPICELSIPDLRRMTADFDNPHLFFNGRSSVLSRSNVPTNGFGFKDIPRTGLQVETAADLGKREDQPNHFRCGVLQNPLMERQLLWMKVSSWLSQELIVDIRTKTGQIEVYEKA